MKIPLSKRIEAFILLGEELEYIINNDLDHPLHEACVIAKMHNPWFLPEFVRKSVLSVASMLKNIDAQKFMADYSDRSDASKTVAIIMAGNIPLVGFHDFAHVLLSGHFALCKFSADDKIMIPFIAEMLCDIEPEFKPFIRFEDNFIKNFDAVIATGSDNTARYFEFYFSKYPHIIRSNRNSLAILTGNETKAQLEGIVDDIFSYFGMGCRNVTLLFVPAGYRFDSFIQVAQQKYDFFGYHHKYMNNYEYYKAIHLVNSTPFIDGGFFMMLASNKLNTPPSVIHYVEYHSPDEVKQFVGSNASAIQCIVSSSFEIENAVPPGQAQYPGFFDFADGVDTLRFLNNL